MCHRSAESTIGAKGAKLLAQALQENTTIKSINLREAKIGKRGTIELKEVLKNEKLSLVELNLRY